jgi:hypothetical protein
MPTLVVGSLPVQQRAGAALANCDQELTAPAVAGPGARAARAAWGRVAV